MSARPLLLIFLLAAACDGRKPSSTTCGIAALAGPGALISEFGVPRQTLSAPPLNQPERLVARLAAGPAYRAVTGRQRDDSLWVIGVDGSPPPNVKIGFGVLVVDRSDKARGVVLFEGAPIENAPRIGTVTMGSSTVPLIGVQTDPARVEDPRCPFFPDSIIET